MTTQEFVPNVLLVEDSKVYAHLIESNLAPEQTNFHWAKSVSECLESLDTLIPDIVICDILLPGEMNGIELCREIKRRHQQTLVIMVSGVDNTFEKVSSLESGADDYITKPFDPIEFRARFRVLLRRVRQTHPHENESPLHSHSHSLTFNDLSIIPDQRTVTLKGEKLDLRRKEYDLLYYLASHAGLVCSREDLLAHIWKDSSITHRTIDAHIQRLRMKIGDNAEQPCFIETLRGIGYRFVAQ